MVEIKTGTESTNHLNKCLVHVHIDEKIVNIIRNEYADVELYIWEWYQLMILQQESNDITRIGVTENNPNTWH